MKRNEKNTTYINESGLYSVILHSKLESTHVFHFRVAKNLTVFWLLYKYLQVVPPKNTPEYKWNETFPLKRNEKNTTYINESGLYSVILHSKLESTHVFYFRVAKNLTIIWLLYKYLQIVPPKNTPEYKWNETFPLKRNEKNTTYINESGLYSVILHSKLESTHVFHFRVAKNLTVFWLLYKYIYRETEREKEQNKIKRLRTSVIFQTSFGIWPSSVEVENTMLLMLVHEFIQKPY